MPNDPQSAVGDPQNNGDESPLKLQAERFLRNARAYDVHLVADWVVWFAMSTSYPPTSHLGLRWKDIAKADFMLNSSNYPR
ncbi:hypothetical protein So717_20620 [Roseobacter cerasinus]|uniref:Uncharacterized protein n=2 Tax=Roseobacter cerasinus TaxID=2602289 RepID=A0A640VQL5_9RHOB|nr:hypothetical protein So717_20620 [Roseobacter cerasinus]